MSEEVPQDGRVPGTPTRELRTIRHDDDKPQNIEHQSRTSPSESQDFVNSVEGEGTFSATEDDARKMSQDSLISSSLRGSPLLHPTRRRYQDSDSCPSVSPSPDPDTRLRTFDFCMVEVSDEGESISAALQTEREFLDFMLSLPQVQKEVPGKSPQHQQGESSGQKPQESDSQSSENRCPTRMQANVAGVVGTKMGLDHLDNLCRMMEQLGELREQNSRLQRRVHYLEELQTLQEMHRHLQETLEARRSGLGLGPIHLSDSDLHLDLDGDAEGGPVGDLSHHGSDESLLLLTQHHHHHSPHKEQFLEPPESPVRRHSSSEDDRRVSTLERDDRGRPHDKEKKGHRSAWGKVKNMISTRKESVRKKSSSSAHRKSTAERPGQDLTGIAFDVSAASDPEEYDVDYEGLHSEGVDPGGGGGGGGLEAGEVDWDSGIGDGGGIWAGPEETHLSTTSLGVRRSKPQLTITVPSSEDLSLLQGTRERTRQPLRSPETAHRKVSPVQMELRASPSLPMTPPSPRRASHWTKVKKAFLTSQYHHQQQHHQHPQPQHHPGKDYLTTSTGGSSSLPPSPSKKTSFHFDEPHLLGVDPHVEDSDSPCPSVEASPDDILPSGTANTTPSPQPYPSLPSPHQQGVQMNIADIQKSLSGEFSRRLQEWEKLKGGQGSSQPPYLTTSGTAAGSTAHPEDNLPQEFKKKLHEWEKMKEREREKVKMDFSRGQEDVKTKIHGEDDLPADFKKKLTEWKIRKALVGKSQQNVEELQKNLGEEFNRKMAEWERIKASANQAHSQVKPSASTSNIQAKAGSPPSSTQGHIKQSASAGQVLVKPLSPAPESTSPRLDRKGSGQKIKKNKANKTDKIPVSKTESGHKGRYKTDKELQWLEKELHKVERETQRLEREKEKFLERQARLEKMRQAMGQGPAAKKEIYIKTSTGEFRFEGISQTFTKKLYEWEERRGIRPESSTIALLDPNYKAPEKEVQDKPKSPELVRFIRSKSESSIAADLVVTSANSHPSSLSLNEMDQDEGGLQAENKAASEPTLAGDECTAPKVAVLVQLEEVVEETGGAAPLDHPATPYAPAEITRNIDSSGSEEDVTRRKRMDDDDDIVMSLRQSDPSRGQGSYRSLLQENMSLLDKLRQKEDLCRALEHQMGDIDSKMDNVADQHLRTLEKLHRQVTIIMKDSSSTPNDEGGGFTCAANDDPEANQRLINQLRARIAELEMQSDHLKDEKEELEMAFKLHKEQETEIAESLVMRIRELQDAGVEVNIQTVQCQTDDLPNLTENSSSLADPPHEDLHEENHEEHQVKEVAVKASKETVVRNTKEPEERREHRHREHRKTKKAPPKKVQKLHNLTGDLLFQAKRLEQALVSKHGLDRTTGHSHTHRQRSLRGRSSLRLTGDLGSSQRRQRENTARTWSSIEAITVPTSESPPNGVSSWEGAASEIKEAPPAEGTAGGLVSSSRSLRFPSAVHSCDPQDILAMNAELSRMAKELRVEMMKMWSFRESTSPESEASESVERRSLEGENKTETDRLVAEANEVFQSIALLQKEGSPPPQASASPLAHSRRSPSTISLSKRRGSTGCEDKSSRRSSDRDRSRSTTCTPSRRDSHRQQKPPEEYEDEEDEDEDRCGKEKERVYIPAGPSLDELLFRQMEEDDRGWEGARRRSSDGLSTVTSGPSRSHSPSPSIASSAPDAELSPRHDTEDSMSLTGTWKTATTSTVRSGEHILSSSFEWEDDGAEERKRTRGQWKAVAEVEENGDERQEAYKKRLKTFQLIGDTEKSFETEVTLASPRIAIRDLKTRRISDTQVEYESFGQSKRDECFANTFSRTVYDDEALTAGRISRNPSVRRVSSRDRDDTQWRRLRSIPSTVSQDFAQTDKSPEIFVPTKRTIFTVQGGALNSDQARATPTFVDIQEDTSANFPRKPKDTPTEKNSVAITVKNIEETNDPTIRDTTQRYSDEPKQSSQTKNNSSTQSAKETPGENKQSAETEKLIQASINSNGSSASDQLMKANVVSPSQNGKSENESVDNTKVMPSDKSRVESTEEERTLEESEALDAATPLPEGRSPRSSRQLTPVQFPINTPMVAMLFQMSPPTSPPIESKRKVLEAANEGVPTVRNIIQKFNQRITENQELLGSPFRSPPTSPPWQSPRSQRRLIAELAKASQMRENKPHAEISVNTNPSGGVLKSLSTSVLMKTDIPPQVQRSASSSLVQNKYSINESCSSTSATVSSPKTVSSGMPVTCDTLRSSPTVIPTTITAISPCVSPTPSPAVSPVPTDPDTSYDLDVSLDDSALASQDISPGEKSPSGRLRAIKLKRAREEFLARGAAPLLAERRLSSGLDSLKMRHRSGTASTDDSWRHSGEISGRSPSPFPSSTPADETSVDGDKSQEHLPKAIKRNTRILKKESFRRQSDGCLLEDSVPVSAVKVVKSASSGVLESPDRRCRQSVDSEFRDSRKSSIDPSIDSSRSRGGFFRLFRRHRSRDKKDLPSVQRLCRQSLLVDFGGGKARSKSASQQPSSDSHLFALPEMDGEEPPDGARSSKTLPRGGSGETVPPAPSRSCPSSPVAPHRNRAANWLARGRQIFKSRSPSPSKKAR